MREPDKLLRKLKYSVDINEVRDYFHKVDTEYKHLLWNWSDTNIIEQWKSEVIKFKPELLTYGYAIQSNLVDLSKPCPPWNISTLPTTEYRNTELAFGIIKQLQERFPYGYRWAISIQPPKGLVAEHEDQEDEYTVWIPIYTKGPAITFVTDKEIPVELESDGSLYLLDTTTKHYTFNDSDSIRVAILFRLNEKYEEDVLK